MKRKLFFITLLMLFCTTMFGQQHWTMSNSDIVKYNLHMTVFADIKIGGETPDNISDIEIAAFHDGILRGVAKPVYKSMLGQYIAELLVYGNDYGDNITFKVFDPIEGKEYDTDYVIKFQEEDVGLSLYPVEMNFYSMHWSYINVNENYMAYPCIIKIDGVEQTNPNLELAAFINNELRGVARPKLEEAINIYIANLMIDGENGDTIRFKLYVPELGELETDYTAIYDIDYDNGLVTIDFRNEAVAQIGSNYYATLQEALKAITSGCTLDILKDITIASDWDCRNTGATITVPVTINGNGKTIKFTGKIYDANWNTLFRFEDVATVKNLTLDASAATDIQRGITFKTSVTVDNCTLIGNGTTARYAVIVGEGAGTDIDEVTANITNSTFKDWIIGVTDNMNGQDMKEFAITGCTFDNTDVIISAYEEVTFTGNTTNSDVQITSYTANNTLNVTAKNNNLAADGTYTVNAGGTLDLQDEFLTPVADVNGKIYFTLQDALNYAVTAADEVTVTLLDNINLEGKTWTPVYFNSYIAGGTNTLIIDGKDKTISNLTDMLFSGTWTGTKLEVKNLTISKANIKHDVDDANNVGVGAIVGNISATDEVVFNNVKLVESHVEGGHWTGGLIGYAAGYSGNDGPVFTDIVIKNCEISGSTIVGKGSVGGVVGHATGDAWTSFGVETTTISNNTITSTGSSVNKAGIVMGTIGAAGTEQTTNNISHTGGVFVSVTESGNTATSNGTAITRIYGRQGSSTGILTLTEGGSYQNNPIEENVAYAVVAPGFKLEQNTNGTYGVVVDPEYGKQAKIVKDGTTTYYTTIADAITAAQPGETVTILDGEYTADITINKAITVVGERDEQGNNLVNITGRVSAHTGATVKNLNVNNTKTGDYDCALNVNGNNIVVDGVKLTGYNAMRYCYASGNITIKNSTINGSYFAVHFDGSEGGNIVFENTDITGWASYAGTVNSVSYEDCDFDKGNYSGHRYYNKNISFNECTFNDGLLIDLKASGSNVAFTDADMTVAEVKALFKDPYYVANGNVTLNNVQVTYAASAYTANGTKYFDNLQDAINEVINGGYITVRSNIELTQGVTVPAGKKITLGLNGYTITGTPTEAAAFAVITNNGNLTIDDTQNGKILCNHTLAGSTSYAVNTITNLNGGVLTVAAGTIENKSTYTSSNQIGYAIDNYSGATVVIKGGKVTASGSVYYDGIRQFCNSETLENNVTIEDGEVSTLWIQNPSNDNVTAVKGSFAITGGTLGNLYLEPSANFSGSISDGHVGSISRHQSGDNDIVSFITGGTFGMDVTEFCAEGFIAEVNTEGTYDVRFADYIVLPDFMDEDNYEDYFGTNTVTDGTNYYATMKAALQAVYGTEKILYCKPGANVGQMTHGAIKQTLTVYGNGAYTSGNGDFDIGNCNYQGNEITNDITLTVQYLDGCGAWGYKNTEHTVNIIFKNCKDMSEVYLTGIAGATNITMNNCEFTDNVDGGNCKVYSNANGNITLTGMLFRNVDKAVNLNHKAVGTQTVTLENCTFTNCGNDVAEDQIPVRVLSSEEGGSSVLTVNACTFTETTEGGADILLDYGVGLTTATVSNTAAYVVVEREDDVVSEEKTTLANQTYTFDNRPYVAEVKVGEYLYKYITIADALTAVPDGGTITLINNATEEFAIEDGKTVTLDMADKTLTGAITPSNANLTIKNGTINNENASYSAIEINAGTLVLNDVKVTSKRHGVRIDGPVTATIEGGEYRLSATSGTRHAVNVSGDANVTIKAGTFVGPAGTSMDSGSAVCVQADATVTIEGGDFSGGKTATLGVSGTMTVTGGTFDQDVTDYCAQGYVCELNTTTNKYEVFRGLAGEGTEANPYLIKNLSDLVFFRDHVNAGETRYNATGVWVALANDIDMTDIANWIPIGNVTYDSNYKPTDASKVFVGVFNGNGKVISNLKVASTVGGVDTQANVGLFGITGEGAVIKNLTLTNVTINTDGRNVGALAGFAYRATLENITVNGDIQIKGGNNVSGVAGMTRFYAMSATDIAVKGNDGSVIEGNNIIGGITAEIAPNGSTQTFKDLSVENVAIKGVSGVGGIVGLLTLGTVENVSVKDVALTGKTEYQGDAMGRIRLGSVAGLMGNNYATIINPTVDNVTAKNLDGNDVVLPIIGANYDASSNATEARIGDTYYATLKHAITAAQANETITLLDNVTLAETATIEKAITLDLNGMNVTVADDAIVFNVKATMTLDGTITGNINLATAESVLIGAQTLNVTTDLSGYIVVYENGQYKLTQGQRVQLANGWNWYSSYINDDDNALETLQTALGTKGVQIKDDVQYTNYYEDYGWYGRLTTIAPNEKMYMIKTSDATEIEIRGEKVDPNTITITIKPGWNYIPYPLDVAQSITTALGFEPQKDDVIKGKGSIAMYMVGTNGQKGWWPDFNMEPGQGYMYYSAASGNKTLTYSAGNGGTQNAKTSVEDNHWIVDEYKYSNNMTVIAMLSIDGEIVKGNYEVAAFANGECRGSARPIYIESIDAYVLFMTIHGDEVEELTFMYYDIDKDTEYELSNVMNYSNDAIVGTIDNPYIFTMNILGIGENSIDNINIYPNPTTTDREINLNATFDKVEVYNALGVKVVEYQNVDTIDALETAGIYVIRVTDNNGDVKHCRLVVK